MRLLRALIRRHHGNCSAAAAELGMSRQALEQRLERNGLVEEARILRGKNGIKGPRGEQDDAALTERIVEALARVDRYDDALGGLDMSRPTLYRHLQRLNITSERIQARRRRIDRQPAA